MQVYQDLSGLLEKEDRQMTQQGPQAGQSNPTPQPGQSTQLGQGTPPPQQDPNAQAQQQQQQAAQRQAAQQQAGQPQQQAQLSPQHVQALSQVQPQHLQRAAQFGEAIQRAGFDMGTFFKIAAIAQKYGPQLAGLLGELQGIFGGGGAPPEGQAQTK